MVLHNMSWVQYPSQELLEIEGIIWSQHVISRFMHVYFALFVPTSLLAGAFSLVALGRRRAVLATLDLCVLDSVVTSLAVTLFSFTTIARPDYIVTSHLSCGVLSFFFNVCYFNAQYLQIAMLFAFLFQDYLPWVRRLKLPAGPLARLSLVLVCAVGGSLGGTMLLGTAGSFLESAPCQVDPLSAWPEYEIVKFSLGFGAALVIEAAFFLLLVGKLVRGHRPRQKSSQSAYPLVLASTLSMFACRLFYNMMLLNRARLKLQRDNGSPRDELVMNIAELVLFAESCASNLAVLFLHQPCKAALAEDLRNLSGRCRREEEAPGGVAL
ncbi:uncharacterized protein LOC103100502 [Monodelphis domestica]|uniref:uncharacterized protein LOC103100502 n=1 Tax=Monodelphis domestica TaxID=13616 RepID=UPI0024E1FE5A|nr:uncharacterized protein LOC103100502 [Monodelphis domestica]